MFPKPSYSKETAVALSPLTVTFVIEPAAFRAMSNVLPSRSIRRTNRFMESYWNDSARPSGSMTLFSSLMSP